MVQRIGGFRRKTKHKLSKRARDKGKITLNRYLDRYSVGDKVQLLAQSSIHKGMYFPRFHGKVGVITKKQGDCYYVKIKDMNKPKSILVHPVHLKRL